MRKRSEEEEGRVMERERGGERHKDRRIRGGKRRKDEGE